MLVLRFKNGKIFIGGCCRAGDVNKHGLIKASLMVR